MIAPLPVYPSAPASPNVDEWQDSPSQIVKSPRGQDRILDASQSREGTVNAVNGPNVMAYTAKRT